METVASSLAITKMLFLFVTTACDLLLPLVNLIPKRTNQLFNLLQGISQGDTHEGYDDKLFCLLLVHSVLQFFELC